MARILAFDYGNKRIGIASTDSEQIIASAVDTVHPNDVMDFLEKYMKAETVECFVVGLPKNLKNETGELENHIRGFIRKLKVAYPEVKIVRLDERFTSSMAMDTMLASGIGRMARRDKETVDRISATILLQSYLLSKDYLDGKGK